MVCDDSNFVQDNCSNVCTVASGFFNPKRPTKLDQIWFLKIELNLPFFYFAVRIPFLRMQDSGSGKRDINHCLMTSQLIPGLRGSKKMPTFIGNPQCTLKQR